MNDKFGWGRAGDPGVEEPAVPAPHPRLRCSPPSARISRTPPAASAAGPWQVLRHIILPLSMPGILIAVALVFIMTFGDFAITPIAGPIYPILARRAHVHEGADLSEWNLAACIGMVIMVASLAFRGRSSAHGAAAARGRRHDRRLAAAPGCGPAAPVARRLPGRAGGQSCCCCGRACRC